MTATENEVARICGYKDADDFIHNCKSQFQKTKFYQIVADRVMLKSFYLKKGINVII